MLTLSIVRHAKSSWEDPTLRDIDRPLNARGKSQAERLGDYLDEIALKPDLIICSTATRARQTLKYMKKYWDTDAELIVADELYLASPNAIAGILDKLGNNHAHIMIIGHNPGLHALAHQLATNGNEDDLALLQEKYPTGTLCVLALTAGKWKKIAKASGKLIYLATPKQLASQ